MARTSVAQRRLRLAAAGGRIGVAAALRAEGHPVEGDQGATLGVLARDCERSAVALSEHGELAVALRDVLPRQFCLVRDARPGDVAGVYAACDPWPWLFASDTLDLAQPLQDLLCRQPVLVLWYGSAPANAPAHTQSFRGFGALTAAVRAAAECNVADMRLAPGMGVRMPSGDCVRSATLEALLSMHPHGFALPVRSFRSAARTLRAHGVPMTPARNSEQRVTLRKDTA